MKAEIITIGDELLIGQVIDTNSAWMAQQLNLLGIDVKQITSISDDRSHILNTLVDASSRADLIIITGGLGPTNDDITKKTLCEYFNTNLVFNELMYLNIQSLFKSLGLQVTEINKAQAEIPENCEPILNSCGTAPGMWFEQNGKVYVSMPGVPFEMKQMMENSILPKLKIKYHLEFVCHKTILTQGIGESFLSEIIAGWEKELPTFIKLAYLPSPGIVRLRLTAKGIDEMKIKNEIKRQTEVLKLLIPDYIYGYDHDKLEAIIGNLLKNNKQTLATAESCTGGYIAHLITGIPGSSSYYKGSLVCYANEIKSKLLHIDEERIIRNGAVSEEVVQQMALNIKNLFNVDYAIATSGIAGPDGGTEVKPVGTTWIAIADKSGVFAKKFTFGDNRERNIQKASITALNLLRKRIID
ncbi:MAG: damage-inducible protein CinA [Bacteroidetes bacterium CG2_30_32_10]|nr:MAG: damage-inducible protein CinA [Bacteroidetes bacterium CG2_30_32_10]